jgi:hypothetical protein
MLVTPVLASNVINNISDRNSGSGIKTNKNHEAGVWFMVLNATFNNISVLFSLSLI